MSRDLDTFLDEVRAESRAAGPAAVAEFEAYLRHFDLSRQVFELRTAHGWSQLELAKQSGIQQSEISRIEHGQGNPTYQTLTALAGALQMRLAFIPAAAKSAGIKARGGRAAVRIGAKHAGGASSSGKTARPRSPARRQPSSNDI